MTDKKIFPLNEPARSWREPRLLKKIADDFCRFDVAPRLAEEWRDVGNAPPAKDEPSPADEAKGTHVVRTPGGPQPAVGVAAEPESAPAVPPVNGSGPSTDDLAQTTAALLRELGQTLEARAGEEGDGAKPPQPVPEGRA